MEQSQALLAERETEPAFQLPKRGFLLGLQLLVTVSSLITIVLYMMGIPKYYDRLLSECMVNGCGKWVPVMNFVYTGSIHLTLDTYAFLFVSIDVIFTFVYMAAAFLIFWKGFREPMALLAVLAMVSFGVTFPSLTSVAFEGYMFHNWWFQWVAMNGWIGLSLLFLLFPNGSFAPKWTRMVFTVILLVDVSSFINGEIIWNQFHLSMYLQMVWYTSSTLILIYAQIYRYLKVSTPAQRLQTKWVVYGLAIGMISFVVMSILFDPRINDGSAITYVYLNALINFGLLAIPVTLTIAVLRHRLWDINPLVNRTLVYGALTLCVAAIYIFSVLYLSHVFETKDNLFISLVATVVVAVVFAPLKEKLQRLVNRMMKGRHDDPYAVLLELGNQLSQPLEPDAMLNALASTIKDSLRLPYAGISIGVGGQSTFTVAAGEAAHEVMSYSIIHRGEQLGTLFLSSRSPGEAFSTEDHKFLDVLLHQAGPIVENVNMTYGLQLLAKDLQESREKLVLAREEERRQIRKNLHDDLAPRLAALALNAATAEKFIVKDPDIAIEMLGDLRRVIRATVDEIRTLVHDLRPPCLDELGLISAIEERITELNKPAKLLADEQGAEPIRIRFVEPPALPELPAAVEVAAYRIVTESLVNVMKHSRATECSVKLQVTTSNCLKIEVTDNGRGVAASYAHLIPGKGGIGLNSIRERAEELGGQCSIERAEHGGTRVLALLPI
ncbi:histidine kinase [Paenibacillus hexagrammi]|uniref:histidine kinase n=1 Tax=Paenibacillus hexagrammi TaxID=2908839 RepID=A0ABY3SR43_9BACL|nr:histidine kinase [Paenibacillus sp. YPD9-1]UJF35724.1 histidine kinase [Paenibacillus sp. YPD9-1]